MLFYSMEKWHIFVISISVFLVLNTLENIIHYSIGRTSNENNIDIQNPTITDWYRILIVMFIFAILQGSFTILFSNIL